MSYDQRDRKCQQQQPAVDRKSFGYASRNEIDFTYYFEIISVFMVYSWTFYTFCQNMFSFCKVSFITYNTLQKASNTTAYVREDV